MPLLTISPNPATPGQTVNVDGSGFDPTAKFVLTTVDTDGLEVGFTSNTNRPRPDGTFKVGINVPPTVGSCYIKAYQRSVRVATALVTVQIAAPPPPPPIIPQIKSVPVASIPDLKKFLGDDSVDEIVVANGRYHIDPQSQAGALSLWIGSAASGGIAFDARKRPIMVRAATKGGAIFDGGGGRGGLAFEDGAHDQTWDGFAFANMVLSQSGVVEVGGYSARRTPHHLTFRNLEIMGDCIGTATTASGHTLEHGIYIAHALNDGPHDILAEDIIVHGEGNLASGLHLYHGSATVRDASGSFAFGAHNCIFRRFTIYGTQQAVILWNETLHDILLDEINSIGAKAFGVRYEPYGDGTGGNATAITIQNSKSSGPHSPGYPGGLHGDKGLVGLTQNNNSWA